MEQIRETKQIEERGETKHRTNWTIKRTEQREQTKQSEHV